MQYSLYVANYDEMVRDDNKSCANGHCVIQGQGEISIHVRWSPLSIGIGVIWLHPRSETEPRCDSPHTDHFTPRSCVAKSSCTAFLAHTLYACLARRMSVIVLLLVISFSAAGPHTTAYFFRSRGVVEP